MICPRSLTIRFDYFLRLALAALICWPAALAQDLGEPGPPDPLVYASLLSGLGEQEYRSGRTAMAMEYYRRSAETVRRYRSVLPRDRDTAAALLAEVEHRYDHAKAQLKREKQGRGEIGVGKKIAITITVAALAGGLGYWTYRSTKAQQQNGQPWPIRYR